MAAFRVWLASLGYYTLAAGVQNSTLSLEKVIVVSRHGIRTPYESSYIGQAHYEAFSKDGRVWPENVSLWGANVSAGLTQHGSAVLAEHGKYYSAETWAKIAGSAAKNSMACSQVTIYADDDPTQRDVMTATAFMSGMLPQCILSVHHEKALASHLFNQGGTNATKTCAGMPSEQIVASTLVGNSINKLAQNNRDIVDDLGDAIGCCTDAVCAGATTPPAPGNCTLMDVGPAKFAQNNFWSLYNGTLDSASNLAEFVQLLYINGMDTSIVVPGLDAYQIGRLTRVHQLNMEVTDGNRWVARSFGSDLLAHLTATMQQLLHGTKIPSLHSQSTDKMVYYAGHDINIYFIRVLLGLSWLTDSWNVNQSPPGGLLRFELLRGPPDAENQPFYVKVYFESQSMEQQRAITPLAPLLEQHADEGQASSAAQPDRVFVAIPTCSDGPEYSCPFEAFKALALRSMDENCVSTVPVDALR